jgi:DNA-binding transcriptional LysR family regulator
MNLGVAELKAFVAVAEELNFTRAAERIHITQPALTRQIRRLEASLGVPLLVRTTRRVELTAAGERLLVQARDLLASADRIVRETRDLGGVVSSLRLGLIHGAAMELTPRLLADFSRRLPDVELEIREFGWDAPSAGLLRGDSDVAIVRPPFTGMERLLIEPLFAEQRVLAVAADDPLAQRRSLTIADTAGRLFTGVSPDDDPISAAFWLALEERGESASPVRTRSPTEDWAFVAAGQAVTITVAGAARYGPVPDIRYIPITDLSPSVVAVAAPQPPGVAALAFLEAAREELHTAEAVRLFSRHGWSRVDGES